MMALVLAFVSLLSADQATFIKAVRANDTATVRSMLASDPSLANAHSPKASAVLSALLIVTSSEDFLDPKANETLQAVLAAKPKLDIYDVAAVGTRDQLEKMLKTNPVSSRTAFGWTLLHLSAFAGNAPNTELLVERGADVNARAKSAFLNTPLQTAMLSGQYETAKILIEHGADVLVRQSHGFTPLHEAASLGRQDLVQLLLDHGAELNSRSDSGKTPLSEAIRAKHDDLAAWLKAKGALVEEDKSGD